MLRPSRTSAFRAVSTAVLCLVTAVPANAASPTPMPFSASQPEKIKGNLEATNGKFSDIVNALDKLLSQVIPEAVYTADSLREKNDLQDLSARLVSLRLAQEALGNSVSTFLVKLDAPSWDAVLARARNSFRQSYSLTSDLSTGKLTFFEFSPTLKENLISALTARQNVQMVLPDLTPKTADDLALVRSLPPLIDNANRAIDKTQAKLKEYISRRFPVQSFGP